MRICMVTTRHRLDDARIVHKEAVSLRQGGHEVVLVYTCDNAWQYRRFDGKVLAIGRAPDGETVHEGFRVLGLPKRSLARKYWMYRALVDLAVSVEADVYHAHEPDISLAVAVRAKALLSARGRPALVVHDMHECPPGGRVDLSPRWLRVSLRAALSGWDRHLANSVDHVFTVNPVLRDYALLLSQHAPVDVLYNGPVLRLFPQLEPPHWPGPPAPLVLSYEGSLGFSRGLKEMVLAVDHLRDRVQLRIVGDVFGACRDWLDAEVRRRGLERAVTRTGWLQYTQVGDAVRSGHAGIILFRESPNNVLATPNKLFNYMNAGLPVLSVGFPELRRIIGDERCGVLVADQSVDAIVRGIEALLAAGPDALRAMGKSGQRAIRERYSWEVMERTMLAAYDEMATQLGRH